MERAHGREQAGRVGEVLQRRQQRGVPGSAGEGLGGGQPVGSALEARPGPAQRLAGGEAVRPVDVGGGPDQPLERGGRLGEAPRGERLLDDPPGLAGRGDGGGHLLGQRAQLGHGPAGAPRRALHQLLGLADAAGAQGGTCGVEVRRPERGVRRRGRPLGSASGGRGPGGGARGQGDARLGRQGGDDALRPCGVEPGVPRLRTRPAASPGVSSSSTSTAARPAGAAAR